MHRYVILSPAGILVFCTATKSEPGQSGRTGEEQHVSGAVAENRSEIVAEVLSCNCYSESGNMQALVIGFLSMTVTHCILPSL